MKWNTSMFIVVSCGLMFCVPVLGLLAICLSIRLRQTLHNNADTVDYQQLRYQEKTVFWTLFFACICLRKMLILIIQGVANNFRNCTFGQITQKCPPHALCNVTGWLHRWLNHAHSSCSSSLLRKAAMLARSWDRNFRILPFLQRLRACVEVRCGHFEQELL